MRKVLIITAILLLVAAAALSWWLLRNQATSTAEKEASQSAKKAQQKVDPKEHNYLDVDFATKMIVHGQQGIQMADIAKKNATNDEVRQLAASISQELADNNKQYISWLTDWDETYFNLSDFPEMEGHEMYPTHPGMASLDELRTLESANGSSVGELFLRLMIAHHEGANQMSNAGYLEDMQFGELLKLKAQTEHRQIEQIEAMKELQAKGN